MTAFTESVIEEAALAWLEATGWHVGHDPNIAPDMPAADRTEYGEVVLAQPLCDSLLPKLISGELRPPTALRERAAQPEVKDAEKIVGGISLWPT